MLILEITLKFLFIFQLTLAAPLDYQEYLSVRKIINEENDKQNDDLPDYSLKEIIKCLNWVFGIGGGAFSIVVFLQQINCFENTLMGIFIKNLLALIFIHGRFFTSNNLIAHIIVHISKI